MVGAEIYVRCARVEYRFSTTRHTTEDSLDKDDTLVRLGVAAQKYRRVKSPQNGV